jgi:hypothetical protein
MACLFGHKWKGCKCEKCGKIRDEQHDFKHIQGKCIKKCVVCEKEEECHSFNDGFRCTECGATRDTIDTSFTDEEFYALRFALWTAPKLEQTTDEVEEVFFHLGSELKKGHLSYIETAAILQAVIVVLPYYVQKNKENDTDFTSAKKMLHINNVDCERIFGDFIKKYGDFINEADGDFKLENNEEHGSNTLLNESVAKLIQLYTATPNGEGFVGKPEAVRRIGQQLADEGGFQLMLEAHKTFSDSYPVIGAARNLEYCWDGIGGWGG